MIDDEPQQVAPAAPELAAPVEAMTAAEAAFERWRRIAGVILAPLAFALVYLVLLAPGSTALGEPGRRLAAILAAVAVLWVTEAIPLPVTAILGAALCVVLGVADARRAFRGFADPMIFLFLGSFMLARAMQVHQLDRRIALGFLSLRFIGGRPARVLAGLGTVTALLSMWVSNTATTAMMLPIALGILAALHAARVRGGTAAGPLDARAWPYATGMMLMVAYAASIGGIGTKVGSPPNLIILGALELKGHVIPFFTWMALMVPMLVVMGLVLFGLLSALHPDRRAASSAPADGAQRTAEAAALAAYIRGQRQALGPWTAGQRNTLIAFSVAVALWVLPGFLQLVPGPAMRSVAGFFASNGPMPEAVVAILAALLLFILPTDLRQGRFTLTWPQATQIDWGTLLLFGGGIALGDLMGETGVAKALATWATAATGASSLWTLTAAMIALGIFLSETTSNTAAATMLAPIAIGMAQAAGVSPVPPALGTCLGASYGFMLPVSTPPNAIVFGSGLVPVTKMIRAGALFDLLGFAIIWTGLRLLCPAMGLA